MTTNMSSPLVAMRPPQDADIVRRGKGQDWYIEFDDINPQAREILEKYSGIAPADVVQHVKDIRELAFSIFVYPCIGMVKFLDIEISKVPCYDEIKRRLTTGGEKYLEVGCCFGQELRKLVIDGVPQESLYASDLDLTFAELGFELFRDKGRLTTPFIAADILAPGPSNLDQLQGQISIVGASLFFHLFSWEQQLFIGRRLVGLLAKDVKGLIVGGHAGADEGFKQLTYLDHPVFLHSASSWQKLWDEIGAATGTRWEATSRKDQILRTSVIKGEEQSFVMKFVVRQL
ncbi:hypothetical protein PWT90_03075 [Aphanocladium album]|nr:hypothetical protein PWT90_03075 [Aphanocladium album]